MDSHTTLRECGRTITGGKYQFQTCKLFAGHVGTCIPIGADAGILNNFRLSLEGVAPRHLGQAPLIRHLTIGDYTFAVCTFCDIGVASHGIDAGAIEAYALLANYHRDDFGPNGYFEGEARP